MKNPKASLKTILLLSLSALTFSVSGATFVDNFDSYVAGSQLHGQAGWKGWDNSPAAGAVVSNTMSFSGLNSVDISGGSDLVHTFTGATSGMWTFSIMQFIPVNATGDSYIILLNQYVDDPGPKSWSLQTHADLAANLLRAEYPTSPGPTLPLIRGQWIQFRADIDLDNNTVSEFYNGTLLTTHTWRDVADVNSLNAVTAVDLYANSASPIFYDNISLIPEASSGALLAMCAFGLTTVRRRRAAV